MDKDIMWLAKRLKDVSKDVEKLSVAEKEQLVERLATISDTATQELYNVLNDFMFYLGQHNRKTEEEQE